MPSHAPRVLLAVAASVILAASSSMSATTAAAATAVTKNAQAPAANDSRTDAVSVTEGVSSTIRGTVPAQWRNSVVVLEVVSGKARQELGTTISDAAGKVKIPVKLGGGGTYAARWRVVKNGRTPWASEPFTITVKGSGKKGNYDADAYEVFAHNLPDQSAANTFSSTIKPSSRSKVAGAVRAAAEDTEKVAEDAAKSTGQMLGDFGTALATGIGFDLLRDGVTQAYMAIFPGAQYTTSSQIQQLTNDVVNGFATVEGQLNSVEATLDSLSTQVSQVQNAVVQAGSAAAAADCSTVLSEANTYVQSIQDVYGNYQATLTQPWFQQNIVGQNPTQALKTLGSAIYGAGAGTPPFTQGVISLQGSVNSLGALLTTDGPTGAGIIPTCASAVSANVAAYFAGQQAAVGLSESEFIVPAGSVQQRYFQNMQAITSYYAGWLALGQVFAARGGQMGAALLSGKTFTSASDINGLCSPVTPSASASALSCAGIAFNVQNTQNRIANAWGLTGASWFMVSNGRLVGDDRAGADSLYMTPAQNVWVQDIAMYGQSAPGTSGGYEPSGPLSSLTEASNAVPASGVNGLTNPSWGGLTFSPAITAQWQSLLPIQNCAASSNCTGGETFGALMSQAGLSNGATEPTNLIVYTGETSTFNTNYATGGWMIAAPSPLVVTPDVNVNGSTGFPGIDVGTRSFLDTNVTAQSGSNPVIGAPSNAATTGQSILTVATPMSQRTYTGVGPVGAQCVAGVNSSCNAPGSYTATISVPVAGNVLQGATNNATFYGQLSQQNSYQVSFSDQANYQVFNYSNETSALTNGTQGGPPLPPWTTSGTPQTQYMWPVLPLPTAGSATPAPCTMTAFSQGFDGQAGVTNTCQGLFQKWQAGALGITTGKVSITAGGLQGTLTPAGNNTAQAIIYNSSSSTQNVTVYASVTSGGTVGTIVNAGTSSAIGANPAGSNANGISIGNCSTIKTNALQCSLTVQPGASVINIPVAYASGSSQATFVLGLAGNGLAASSTTTIAPVSFRSGIVPAAVTGLTANASTPAAGASASSAAPQAVVLSWTVPSSAPAVSGYQFTITDPSGTVTTQSAQSGSSASTNVDVTNGYTAGATATVTLDLPTGAGGPWTFGVVPVNVAGVGPAASVTASLGTSAPATPTGFTATQNDDGTIALQWNPVSANPPLSNYAIVITPPSTGSTAATAIPVQSTLPSYTVQNVTATGTWSFSLTSVNSVGASKPVVRTLPVSGIPPTQPQDLQADVDSAGWVSASFTASDSIPVADTYYVGLFAPGSYVPNVTQPVAVVEVAASNRAQMIKVRNFYRLSSTSPTGTWTVVVLPKNSIGTGEYAQSDLYVSPALLTEVSNNVAGAGKLANLPSLVQRAAAAACAAGTFNPGLSVFGTCTNGVFTPNASTTGTTSTVSGS